uniref:ANK_REP_REGION domain-containing protein n=2 Tax=Macrostomum lignano TaxID=282301 RepID=A0A1I8HBV8_9PLAT
MSSSSCIINNSSCSSARPAGHPHGAVQVASDNEDSTSDRFVLASDSLPHSPAASAGDPASSGDAAAPCTVAFRTEHPEGTRLHRLAFAGDVAALARAVRDLGSEEVARLINIQDKHGNTALHIAIMRGHHACVTLLTGEGASVRIRNRECWSPICEAVSYGDRKTILHIIRLLHRELQELGESRRQDLIRLLKSLPDFYLEIKWDFQTWVPLLSRLLPSDVCRLYKKGARVRMDSTLVDFEDMRWTRGDISFLYNGEEKARNAFVMLDNAARCYQRMRRERNSERDLASEADMLMASDVVFAKLDTARAKFSRQQQGWLWRRHERSEQVGAWSASFYEVRGLRLCVRKRREHLSAEDVRRNKEVMEKFAKGHVAQNLEFEERHSLPPPTPPPEPEDEAALEAAWAAYLAGDSPYLGRKPVLKDSIKTHTCRLAMAEDFPLDVKQFLELLRLLAPFKQFNRLREFLSNQLPPGFPVKIEMPVYPTITAQVSFRHYELRTDLADSLFAIPEGFKHSRRRFPNL